MRVLANGLGFPEGPVACPDGSIVFVDIRNECLWRHADGETARFAVPGGSGPNGATRTRDGSFYVANNGGLTVGPGGYWFSPAFGDGSVSRILPTGSLDTSFTVDLSSAEHPHRPNDICIGPDGLIYFTDPANWEDFAQLKPGRVWRCTSEGKTELLAEVPMFPNGIGFGVDGRLYVARTLGQEVVAFPWSPAGLGEMTTFCTLPSGFPDGFAFAASGDVYVCGSMGDVLHVFDPEGALKQTIEFPEHSEPTNCCFGKGELFVTLSGSGELVALDVDVEGAPLYA